MSFGLLSYLELVQLVEDGVITNVEQDQINGSSIDITLGGEILIEEHLVRLFSTVELSKKQCLRMGQVKIEEPDSHRGYKLAPGEFILACSEQVFNLPLDISAELKLKSSTARIGLEHLNAGWCDPGWNGSVLTLELKNMTQRHFIVLHRGDRIGQMVFFRHVPVLEENSYRKRGRYNQDKTVSGVKKSLIFHPVRTTCLCMSQCRCLCHNSDAICHIVACCGPGSSLHQILCEEKS